MAQKDFISLLGLERSIKVSDVEKMSESQSIIAKQVVDFDVDGIYFSTNESKSYPAVFIKQVSVFDEFTIKKIANIQQKLWNYQKVLFLYVYNDTEIRIYNCTAKPFCRFRNSDYDSELEKLELYRATSSDEDSISQLVSVFSAMAMDSGIIWSLPEAADIRSKINLQRRVDKYLVESLKRTTEKLQQIGLNDIAVIHKIILRSLFLLYLEDRGATDSKFYGTILINAEKYFDILKDVNATYRLYSKLEEQFNGNVFSLLEGEREKVTNEHLEVIRKCFINGYENDGQTELFEDWRLFDFKIIRIELLSEIYEHFLKESDPKGKKGAGAYYTPTSLVELILDEVLPIESKYTDYNVKILDPACGSGIFLVEGYKRLLQRYENAHGKKPTDFKLLKDILLTNIYGIEQNEQAIIVAAFSLYLALVDNLDPKTVWISTKLPCLVNAPDIRTDKKGNNLFCRDTIRTNTDIEGISFDLVVGNPPFGTENKSKNVVLPESIRSYCEKNGFAKEMVLPFLHKAVAFAPKGKIAMIFNAKILTNTGSKYRAFRKWLFQDCYVGKVYNFSILRKSTKDFGGQLFGSAVGPVCIAFYQMNEPVDKSDKVVYYAPKTYIKSNVLEGVVIDSSDVKYLPRKECQKPDTKIWKIAMWGGDMDYELIQRLSKLPKLRQFLSKNKIQYGVGLQFVDSTTKRLLINDNIPQNYIRPDSIGRYVSSNFERLCNGMSSASKNLYSKQFELSQENEFAVKAFRRIGNNETFEAPHILLKEGLHDWNICASYIEKKCSFNSKVIGIYGVESKYLKGLTCFLNSLIVQYYVFLSSPSIGIEREEIKKNEIDDLPFILDNQDLETLAAVFDKYIVNDALSFDANGMETEINSIIFDKYGISKCEKQIIVDFANFTKSLMIKSVSNIVCATRSKEIIDYLKVICSSLNDFLDNQDLFVNGTLYSLQYNTPLVMIKISFGSEKHDIVQSDLTMRSALIKLDKYLWAQKGSSVYFRKNLNHYDGNDIYIIRPNQRRFWTQSAAMQDASNLIIEILNMEG